MKLRISTSFQMHMIGKNLSSLYERVGMDMLPTEYLPDDYTGSKVGSVKDCVGKTLPSGHMT